MGGPLPGVRQEAALPVTVERKHQEACDDHACSIACAKRAA